jgi:MerR family transcriptional regulator/heat shock protein HspR
MKRKKGFYSISVVAKMFSVHQQTIRMYEKEGLLAPKRSDGNTRLFSEDDVDRLEEIINLTHKMGVNLAGVEIILRLQKKIKRLQDDMNKLFNNAQGQLEQESNDFRTDLTKQAERLGEMKKEGISRVRESALNISPITIDSEKKKNHKPASSGTASSQIEQDDWEIDYENDK